MIDPHPKSVTAPLSTKDPRSRLLADENGDPVLAGILHPDAELTSNDIENTSPRQHEFPEGSGKHTAGAIAKRTLVPTVYSYYVRVSSAS